MITNREAGVEENEPRSLWPSVAALTVVLLSVLIFFQIYASYQYRMRTVEIVEKGLKCVEPSI
jgi:hypothetical protein